MNGQDDSAGQRPAAAPSSAVLVAGEAVAISIAFTSTMAAVGADRHAGDIVLVPLAAVVVLVDQPQRRAYKRLGQGVDDDDVAVAIRSWTRRFPRPRSRRGTVKSG